MGIVKTLIEKGRQVKSRGIALTHKDQGYSANKRHVSLLTKSAELDPKLITKDVVKALEQVELKISMQEFLRRFFNMWYDDAELLTKVLGMTTEREQEIADNPPAEGSWEENWNKETQEYLEKRLSSISIIKKAKEGSSLTPQEQYEIFKTRKLFEQGCEDLQLSFGDEKKESSGVVVAPTEAAKPAVVVKTTTPEKTESSAGAPTNTDEDTPVDKEVDVTKSQQFLDLMKSNQELVAQVQGMQESLVAAQEIVKAQKDAARAVAVQKASAFSFVAADQREVIADVIENPAQATILAVLEKAAADLKAKDEELVAKNEEIEAVKASFADGKEVGVQGELSKAAKGSEDAQERLNNIIKARAGALNPAQLTA